MNIEDLVQQAHATAVVKGWWEANGSDREFGTLMALVHSEASEAFEAFRDALPGVDLAHPGYSYRLPSDFPYDVTYADGTYTVSTRSGKAQDMDVQQFHNLLAIHKVPVKPEGVPSELADIVIRVADICGYYGIDLDAAITQKMAYNRTRPYRHGGKRA